MIRIRRLILINADLTSSGANVQLHWALYKDGVFAPTSGINITGYTATDQDHFIRLFAPTGTLEVGTSQRHTGKAATGVRVAPNLSSGAGITRIFAIFEDYVRFDGIEIDGTNVTGREDVIAFDGGGGEIYYENLIIHDLKNSTIDDTDASRVVAIAFNSSSVDAYARNKHNL